MGGVTPTPRKLRLLSARMSSGTDSVATTMMWLSEPGTKCLVMIRHVPAPTPSAASTYSSLRYASTFPRTTRAKPPQPMSDIATTIPMYTQPEGHVAGIAAENASHSGILGNEINTSMNRCSA